MLTTGIGAEETVSVVNIIFTSHAGLDLTDTVASLSKNAIIKADTVFIVLATPLQLIGVQFRHVIDDDKKANNVVPSSLRYLILSAPDYNLRSFFF